jgi:hypothetical protein
MGTLTSAFLLNSMFRVFGSQILGMCLLSAVLRFAVVRLMLPKLKPGGIPDAIVHEELARELAMVNYPTRQGLYYHPEVWSRFTKPVAAFGTMLGKAVNKISPRPAGLYYNPQQWSNYMGQNSDLQPGMVQASTSEPEKSGLYHDKKAWAEYMQQTAVQMEPGTEHAREGLLYNPEAWADAVNQTLKAEGKSVDTSKPVRKGLLYDPEAWAALVNQMAQANTKFSESLKPVRKGLLHDPEALAMFVKQTAVAEARAIDGARTARTGIFYDSQKWSDYLKQSMVLNATTMRTAGDSLSNRQPIFYHPEMWNNYKNQTALPKVTNVKTNARVMSTRQPLLYHPEEWDRTFDPAMVHIGRKSAIGTIVNKQNQIKKMEQKIPSNIYRTATKSALTSKRIGTRPSMA